jgi:bifunctional DNase/RNase
VDSRPSDAIALAIRAKVPIFVEESVLDQAGMLLDSETEESSGESVEPAPVDEEKLSVFKDFIETLDIEDLGKGGADPRK